MISVSRGTRHLLLATVGLAVITVGVSLQANQSVPGDPFYGMKEAVTEIRSALATGGSGKAKSYLNTSIIRADELAQLVAEDAPNEVILQSNEALADDIRRAHSEIDQSAAAAAAPATEATGSVPSEVNQKQHKIERTLHRLTDQKKVKRSVRRALKRTERLLQQQRTQQSH